MRTPEEVAKLEAELRKQFRDSTPQQVQTQMDKQTPDSDERRILREIREEKRRAEEAPAQERFDKTYEQAERHHREARRLAWTAAVISIVSAFAAAVSAWFAWHPPQPPAGPAPTPPVVASPSPMRDSQ